MSESADGQWGRGTFGGGKSPAREALEQVREDTSVPTGRRVASPGRQEAGGTRGRDVLGVTRRSVGVTPRDNGPLVKGFKLGTSTAEDISPMTVALGLGTSYEHWFATLHPEGLTAEVRGGVCTPAFLERSAADSRSFVLKPSIWFLLSFWAEDSAMNNRNKTHRLLLELVGGTET